MFVRRITMVGLVLLVGCASQAQESKLTRAKVEFFERSTAYNAIKHGPRLFDPGSPRYSEYISAEESIAGYCGAKGPPLVGEAAIVAWAIGVVGKWIVKQADASLQAEVNRYSARHSAVSEPFDLYDYLAKSRVEGQQRVCFRMTELPNSSAGSTAIVPTVELIGVAIYKPNSIPETLEIRPLRLYVRSLSAKTSSDQVVLATTLAADAIWLDPNRGRFETGVFNATFLGATVKPSELPYYQTFPLTDSKPSVKGALPPWNAGDGLAPKHSQITASIALTEVGDVPWLLQHASDLLHDNRDSVASTLISEAKKVVGDSPQQ
ncbi:hypothetical protein [Caballeronia sp. GAOx1]|uniref:hypothetical protein n=1 Tax=Caballeronia sp. GAOx1 TaxID=2921761 RepID=UPI002027A57D|nr:hypothetical protein [Caballeronia sp. GAOx1]